MNQPAQQDIDSGSGKVITPGEPVEHVDMVDGQSAGHTIEPAGHEGEIHEPGHTVSEKPDQVSRGDIYKKASELRDAETEDALAGMEPAERAHYHRMIAEAGGVTEEGQDPFDGDGELREGWVDPAEPEQAPAKASKPVAETATDPLDAGDETVTITVYGMQQVVPKAEVDAAGGLANYQKNVAADERMRRLSTYEASLRTLDQELQQRATAMSQPQATSADAGNDLPPTGDQGESVDVRAAAEKLVGAMYTGDREAAITEAAEVLASIRKDAARAVQPSAAQPGEPTQSLAEQQAAQQRAALQAHERDEANHVFVAEFSDLQTPVLRDATYQMVQRVAAEPIMYGRPLAEVTREAGTRVRNDVFKDRPAPAPATKPVADPAPAVPAVGVASTDLASRMALKSRTVVQPLIPAAGRFTEPAEAGQRTESNSEYISRMKRESRGQA